MNTTSAAFPVVAGAEETDVSTGLVLCSPHALQSLSYPQVSSFTDGILFFPAGSLLCSGAEETDVSTGFVLCSLKDPTPMVSTFECQLVILELLEHNPIFTVGYRWVERVSRV
jgi:hypothetical protein